MAVKASAYNDSRRYENPTQGLKEQTWYQDLPGTAVYEFQEKKGQGYIFEKRGILDLKKTKRVRLREKDLSFLVPIEVTVVGRGRNKKRRATLTRGPAYVRTP